MKVVKVIFGILTAIFAIAAIITVCLFNGGTIPHFWTAADYFIISAGLAVLCFFGAKYAAEAEEERTNPTVNRKGPKIINHLDYKSGRRKLQ